MVTFWASFRENLATFNSNIWSHCTHVCAQNTWMRERARVQESEGEIETVVEVEERVLQVAYAWRHLWLSGSTLLDATVTKTEHPRTTDHFTSDADPRDEKRRRRRRRKANWVNSWFFKSRVTRRDAGCSLAWFTHKLAGNFFVIYFLSVKLISQSKKCLFDVYDRTLIIHERTIKYCNEVTIWKRQS